MNDPGRPISSSPLRREQRAKTARENNEIIAHCHNCNGFSRCFLTKVSLYPTNSDFIQLHNRYFQLERIQSLLDGFVLLVLYAKASRGTRGGRCVDVLY